VLRSALGFDVLAIFSEDDAGQKYTSSIASKTTKMSKTVFFMTMLHYSGEFI
jgi:hypothetical protein